MLTTDRVDHFATSLADALAKLPSLVNDVRETVEDREKLIMELDEKSRVLDTMNVLVNDLRHQIKALQDRAHELVQQNAKLENVIMSAGRALASDATFQSAARELAAPQPERIPTNNMVGID
jgi:regulator of replication initiation timing